jgi:tetratricopeptide (TPR) repeat protein
MEALDGSIESAVAYEVRGARALDDGKWTEAATYFRKGIELAPDEPSLRHKLGTALAMTGDARGAMEQFREAVRRSPGFVKAHYSLGLLLAGDGRVGEALDEFSAALKEDPTYAEARLQLAEILRRLGRLPDALRQYDQVIQTDPRLADARFGAAIVLGRMSRFGEARARLIDARRLHPDHVRIAIALARILAAAPGDTLRNGTEAMVIVQQINDRGIPNEPAARVELIETAAMASAEAGQFDRAIGAQREAIGMAEAGGRHDLAQRMAGNLKLYESRRPSRTPWREDEF